MVSPDEGPETFEDYPWEDPLSLEKVEPGKVDVYFQHPQRADGNEREQDGIENRVRLLQIDGVNELLTMFPMKNILYADRPIRPKYDQIRKISFAGGRNVYSEMPPTDEEDEPIPKLLGPYLGRTVDVDYEVPRPEPEETSPTSTDDVLTLLDGLPSFCVKDPQYGLGLRRAYRSVIHAIEELTDAEELHISNTNPTGYSGDSTTFVVSASDMLALKKLIDRVNSTSRLAANTVNETSTYNQLAVALDLPTRPMRYGRAPLRKALTALGNGEKPLSPAEQLELLQALTQNASSILEREPATMDGLESEIATARARDLLGHLQQMMRANHNEPTWQRFLQKNPFVLSLVFGRPFVSISGQASVGGRRIDGSGDKITDFLAKHSLTNNAALVEIKTPNLRLLNKKEYRKGVYTASADLVGGMNQALDQKNRFEQEIAQIKHRNPSLRVEAHHVQTYLLAGSMPTDVDRVRSFEMFRHNSKDVVVMTFDELMSKVEHLCAFLEGRDELKEEEPPF